VYPPPKTQKRPPSMADAWLYRSAGPDPDSTWNHATWQLGCATQRPEGKPTWETAASTQVVLVLCSKLLGAASLPSACSARTIGATLNFPLNIHLTLPQLRLLNCLGAGRLVVVVMVVAELWICVVRHRDFRVRCSPKGHHASGPKYHKSPKTEKVCC